jgi:hypothetical protein
VIDDSDDSDTLRYPGFTYENMDNMKVLTSCDVPKQARACNLPTLKLLLCSACRQAVNGRQALPMEVADIILTEAMRDGGLGMSREEAERRRRMLMEDRRVQTKNVNGVSVSCSREENIYMLMPRSFGPQNFRYASINEMQERKPDLRVCTTRNLLSSIRGGQLSKPPAVPVRCTWAVIFERHVG